MNKTNKILSFLLMHREGILYLVFGVLSTMLNIGTYYACYDVFRIGNVPSVIIAWVLAVIFAYLTNKIWVFESKSYSANVLIREILSFFSCRIATGLIDLAIMYVSVDIFGLNEVVWKIISNIVVVICNYVASKLIIFTKGA